MNYLMSYMSIVAWNRQCAVVKPASEDEDWDFRILRRDIHDESKPVYEVATHYKNDDVLLGPQYREDADTEILTTFYEWLEDNGLID